MKFDTLYNNLIIEQDAAIPPSPEGQLPQESEQQEAEAQNVGAVKVPQPDNFDDVEPMPQVDTTAVQEQLKQQIAKLLQLSKDINGYEGPEQSIQQFIFSIDKPGGVYKGISDAVDSNLTKASGALLEAANTLSGYVISTSKRAQELAYSR